MKCAFSLPAFGHLADPAALIDLAVAAEQAGFDGFFLWDHVYRPAKDPAEILDPWVIMGALAAATSTIRLGPMVTPITRRRPIKLAREALTVDHLSGGRLTLGLGLGVDSGGELSRFGEIVDARERGRRLDEGVDLLVNFFTGDEVTHQGQAFEANQVTVLPRPIQRPSIPLWFAARGASGMKPVRRAARFDGLMPIELTDGDHLSRLLDVVVAERGSLDGFDTMVGVLNLDAAEAQRRGATWSYRSIAPSATPHEVLDLISAGPWI